MTKRPFRQPDDSNSESANWKPSQNPFSVRFVRPGAVPFFFERSFLESCKKKNPQRFQDYLIQSLAAGTEVRSSLGIRFLADAFEELRFKAQIVGSHGTGKSTLVYFLAQTLQERGYPVFSFALHDDQRSLPVAFWNQLDRFFSTRNSDSAVSESGMKPSLKSGLKSGSESSDSFRSSPNAGTYETVRLSSDCVEYSRSCSVRPGLQKIVVLDGFEQLSFLNRVNFRSFCRARRLGILLTTHSSAVGVPVLFRANPSFEILRKIVDYLLDEPDFVLFESEIRSLQKQAGNNIRQVLFDLYDAFENRQNRSFFNR